MFRCVPFFGLGTERNRGTFVPSSRSAPPPALDEKLEQTEGVSHERRHPEAKPGCWDPAAHHMRFEMSNQVLDAVTLDRNAGET